MQIISALYYSVNASNGTLENTKQCTCTYEYGHKCLHFVCCRRTWFGALWRTGGSSSLPSPRWSSTRIRSSPTTGIMWCWMRATRSGTLMPRSRRHANRWVVFRSVDLLCFILFNSLWLLPLFPYFVTQIINSLQFNIFLQFNNKLSISCYFLRQNLIQCQNTQFWLSHTLYGKMYPYVYVVSWQDFAVLLVSDTSSHHFVWFPYSEQPEGVMVLVWLCVSRETWHSARFPAAFLYSYRTRRLRQCNRNPGLVLITIV